MEERETSSYWSLLGQVMAYAVDDTPSCRLLLGSEVVAEIKPEVYFEQLYVRLEDGAYETRLAEHLLSSVPPLVLASSRGSGRSSAIWYACELIRRDPKNADVAVVVVDFRRLFHRSLGAEEGLKDAILWVAQLIATELRAHFFPGASETRELLAWLVAGPPDSGIDFEEALLTDLHDVATRVCNKAHADQPSRQERFGTLNRWFESERGEFVAVYSEISQQLRATHIAVAALRLRALRKIVLIYDNLDILPTDYQHAVADVANDTQFAMGQLCTSCVVIRTENLRSPHRADHRAGSVLTITMPNAMQYPGLLLPQARMSHLQAVIDRRQEFVSGIFRSHEPDEEYAESLNIVHRTVLSEFADSSIYDLSNGNIRAIAALYVGFTHYLFTLFQARHVTLEDLFGPEKQQGFGHTLFYLWLGEYGDRYGLLLPDLLPPYEDETSRAPHEFMNVHYCILAVLNNLTQQDRGGRLAHFYAECRQVFSPILDLGFDMASVLDGLSTLSAFRRGGSRLVEFLRGDLDVSSLSIDSTEKVRLTEAGAVLLTSIITKVGYVWRAARAQQTDSSRRGADQDYLSSTVTQRLVTMMAYLRRMVSVELRALSAIRASWEPKYGDRWMERYRSLFGVDGKTLMEGVVDGAARFYDPVFRGRNLPNAVRMMTAKYGELLEAIKHAGDYELSFAALLGRSEAVAEQLVALDIDRPQWVHWLGRDTPSASVIEALPRQGPGWPILLLRRLRLRNIKCFESLDLDLTNKDGTVRTCTALVGNNATGKTTILQAIALGVLGPTGANQVAGSRALRFLRRGKKYGTIELELAFLDDSQNSVKEAPSLHVALGIRNTEEGFFAPSKDELSREVKNSAGHLDALRRRVGYQWGLCCGYGAFRGIAYTEQGVPEDTSIAIERVLSLFQRFGTLIDPDILVRIWQDSRLASISGSAGRIPLKIRDRILDVLVMLIPGLEAVRSGKSAKIRDRHGGTTDPTELSDGCNSMLALIGHLVRHSLEVYGCQEDPFEARGIVLIDEVDLHIHPSWQKRALPQIQEAFGQLQFIVTTHSPLVVGGVADGRVTVLKKDEKGRIGAYSDAPSVLGWRVDQILTGQVFDLASAYGDDTERRWTEYAELLGELGPEHPKVREIELELDRRRPKARGSTPEDREAWQLMQEFIKSRVQDLTQDERGRILASLRDLFKG